MLSITLSIVIITCLVSIAAFSNNKIMNDLIFYPATIKSRNQYYRFFTYGFIHADFIHLAFNMISLWSFGQLLESERMLPDGGMMKTYKSLFGDKGGLVYLALYILAIIVSVIPDYVKYRNNYAYRALGASGAVSAVIFAAIALEPKGLKLTLFLIPIPIPGYIFALIFVVLSTYLARKGGDNIGHGAHLTGAIFGLVFTIVAAKLIANYDVVQGFIAAFKQ